MSTIGSNIAALKSLHNLRLNEDGFAKATERLSSGKRLNSAGDDAAGAAIVNRMSSQIAGMNVAIRNAGDAISMSQVAEGALHEVSEILQRMRELAVQAANGSYSGADRVSLNQEIVSLKKELIRIGETTTFNTTKLLNGTFQDTEFEISFDESPQHTHSLSIEDIRPNKIGVWNMSSQMEKTVEVASCAGYGTEAVITTTADHGLKDGDIVTYQSAFDASGATGEQIFGLTSGKSYLVNKQSETTFSLQDLDGTAINDYGAGGDTAGFGDGTGAKFHLNSLGNAPAVASNATTPVSSNVLGAEELDIYGYVGKATARFKTGATARDIANSVNALESKTGVYANASTHARITLQPDNSTDEFTVVSFDIYGMNTTAVPITASIKFGTGDNSAYPDLSDLRDKINGFSGDTGINARLSADGSYLDLTSPDGHDIVIDGFDLPHQNDTTYNTTVTVANPGFPTGADPDITAVGHPFQDGDIVRVNIANNETSEGLIEGRHYVVKDVRDSDGNGINDRFKIATYDSNGTVQTITMSAAAAQTVSFTKVEKGLSVQTLDRDENLKGVGITLVDKEIAASQSPAPLNSVRLTGAVNFESSNVFTVTPKTDESLFRDDPESASLRKISDMDVLSVRNAQRMMSAVDGALRRVDAERGDLGATMNRMEHTIDNLSNIVVNTTVSRGRIEDADMAEESVNLSKSQVLQQAATAMLAQANQSMQSVLDLLR